MTSWTQSLLAAALLCATLSACAEQPGPDHAGLRGGRIRPPAGLACDRNQLTSYSGVVSEYRREPGELRLRIDTDSDTVEHVVVRHAGDIDEQFLVLGQPFAASDWARIESAPGVLIQGTRATAWVCSSAGNQPVIDWRPDESR